MATMLARPLPRLGRRLLVPIASRSSSKSSSVPASKSSNEVQTTPTSQSPNYPSTWSTSQRPRADILNEARFEQTALEFQPQPLSAMQMIANEPIRVVHGRRAVCDGGMGPLGHPKIFINLDQPGAHACGYCGIRFEQAPHSGHGH